MKDRLLSPEVLTFGKNIARFLYLPAISLTTALSAPGSLEAGITKLQRAEIKEGLILTGTGLVCIGVTGFLTSCTVRGFGFASEFAEMFRRPSRLR